MIMKKFIAIAAFFVFSLGISFAQVQSAPDVANSVLTEHLSDGGTDKKPKKKKKKDAKNCSTEAAKKSCCSHSASSCAGAKSTK